MSDQSALHVRAWWGAMHRPPFRWYEQARQELMAAERVHPEGSLIRRERRAYYFLMNATRSMLDPVFAPPGAQSRIGYDHPDPLYRAQALILARRGWEKERRALEAAAALPPAPAPEGEQLNVTCPMCEKQVGYIVRDAARWEEAGTFLPHVGCLASGSSMAAARAYASRYDDAERSVAEGRAKPATPIALPYCEAGKEGDCA